MSVNIALFKKVAKKLSLYAKKKKKVAKKPFLLRQKKSFSALNWDECKMHTCKENG